MDKKTYWRKQLGRSISLLVIWAIAGLGMSIVFVEPLNRIDLGGIPFGFWMAQQGAIFVFILLILAYAILSGRADRTAGFDERDAAPPVGDH
jgi:putative solute:sodium symporter small subunit